MEGDRASDVPRPWSALYHNKVAKHPVTPPGSLVAVVNLDMPVLLYDFVDVVAFGAEHSTLGKIVEQATARAGVKTSPDPLPPVERQARRKVRAHQLSDRA